MPSDSTASSHVDTTRTDDRSSTLVNALIGAVAGIVLSFIPFSPVLGGGVAGYLEGPDTASGVRVGAIAGVIMLIPFAIIGMAIAMFMFSLGTGGPSAAFGLFAFFIVLLGAVYTVGLSMLGGYLGSYLNADL